MIKKTTLPLIFIILLSFAYRIYIILNSSLSFYSDDAIYAALARFFWKGNFSLAFHPTWPPFFPFLSTIFFFFLRNWEDSLRFVSLLSGTLIIIPFYFLVKDSLSTLHAIFLSLIFSFSTPILLNSLFPLSDMLATLLIFSSIFLVSLGIKKNQPKSFLFSSFLLGLAFLTRSEGTMFFFFTFFYLVIYLGYNSIQKRKITHNIQTALAFAFIFFITISPYLIITRLKFGNWTMSQKFSAQIKQGHSFAIKDGTTWSQEVASIKYPNYKSEYFKGGFRYITENQSWFWWSFNRKLTNWVWVFKDIFPLWSIPFMLLGSLNIFRKRNFWILGYPIYILITAVPITIFSTVISDVRYLLWTFPLFLYFFYLGVNLPIRFFKGKFTAIIFVITSVLLSLNLSSFSLKSILHPTILAQDFTRNNKMDEIVKTTNWIKENTKSQEPRIMLRHEGVEFYTNGVTIYLPEDLSYEETLSYAKKNNVDYWIAWSHELATSNNLSFLLKESANPKSLKKVYSSSSHSQIMIVYEVEY